ncbi:hypothetical protein PENTCL1PPCAC_22293 [Pristionchus entomophagus]|uniref:G protein-coupled receptor n=1 Tax=Pristionchus entomophagus TaxID=358040 RepID=A0AAV5U107_9BILA|nr:hypothetical protein PENTCL1PPCAC_22293 [Pristionchus entomophagus]
MDRLLAQAVYVRDHSFLRVLLYIRVFTATLGVLGFVIVYRLLRVAVHRNLAIALSVHCVWTTWMNFVILVDTVIQFHRFSIANYPQELFTPGIECYLRMIPFSMGVYGEIRVLMSDQGHRFFATLLYRNYDKCPLFVSSISSIVQMIVPISMVLGMSIGYGIDEQFAYCTVSTPGNADAAKGVVFSFLIYEIIALILHFGNKRLLKRVWGGSLTERYQVCENLRLLSTLTPIVVCHLSITVSIATGYTIYVICKPDAADRDYPILEEVANFVHIHGIVMPALLFVKHRRKMTRDREMLDSNTHLDRDAYLSFIEKGW